MKGLKKIKSDHYATDFVMGKILGVSEDYYKRLEKMEDKDIPPKLKEKTSNVEDLEKQIDDYYTKQEEFYNTVDLIKLAEDMGKDVDAISNETLISPVVIDDCIFNNQPFPTNTIKDKLIDYFILLKKKKKQKQMLMMSNNNFIDIPNSEIANVPDTPELPTISEQDTPMKNTDIKDAEIAGLNRQLDWYEQIIDTFMLCKAV